MLLAGDIGGTKTKFALFSFANKRLKILHEAKYESKKLSSLEEGVTDYLEKNSLWQSEGIEAAWFCVAAPVFGNICKPTNLDGSIDLEVLRKRLAFIPEVGICNDLVASGYGISLLPDQELLLLSDPVRAADNKNNSRESANRVVLAPGTGLGESLLIAGEVYPTEGAHADFAPMKEEDLDLWRFLHQQFGHVSCERVLSGPGLTNIYRFLRNRENCPGSFSDNLKPEEISGKALARTCPLCMEALHIFVRLLGAEAGNLALKSFALGGVYLGGGIPPKIKDKLTDGTFRAAFTDKGRFCELLKKIPVYLILEENVPLLGAARLALRKLGLDAER